MTDVFISYAREDRPRVEMLSALLADLDLTAWFDASIEVGESWESRIFHEAETASAMIVCWTFAACASPWVNKEAHIGLKRGVLAPVQLSYCGLSPPFDKLQMANLSEWKGEPGDPELLKLLDRLEYLTGVSTLVRAAKLRGAGQDVALVALLRALLVARARAKAPPYKYLEAEAALREAAHKQRVPLIDFHQPIMWAALDSIADENRRRREPLLGALVVSEKSGLPGRGYFQKLAFLDGPQDDVAHALHARHVERAHAYSWPNDP